MQPAATVVYNVPSIATAVGDDYDDDVVFSGGLPIRQNRQLPKARHGAGSRPVHCEFFLYLINVHVFVKQLQLHGLLGSISSFR